MDNSWSQAAVADLIRDKFSEFGSIKAALSFVHHHLLDVLPVDASSSAPAYENVFPRQSSASRGGGRLYRCRGMIQEVSPDLTLYRAAANDFFGDGPFTNTSGANDYGTEKSVNDACGDVSLLEAVLLYVIPVPGNTHFYAPPLAEEERVGGSQPAAGRAERKRRRSNDETADASRGMDENAEWTASRDSLQYLNLPHPPLADGLAAGCLVTVLSHEDDADGTPRRRFGLNDVMDFFGFIDAASGDGEAWPDADGIWRAARLPPPLAPRMTCVAWRPLTLAAPNAPNAAARRARVWRHLTDTLCQGDALVAEYVLLHLCAKVAAHANATPVGDLPLRVEADGAVDPAEWSAKLRRIVPVAEILFGADLLGSKDLRPAPVQDHTQNVLHSGVLQLAKGTHVTLDSRAVASILPDTPLYNALFAAIHKQVLILQYPYQVHELPIDIGFLALSTTRSEEDVTLLRFATSVKWIPQVPTDAALKPVLTDEEVREFFSMVRSVQCAFDTDASRVAHLAETLVSFSTSEPSWNNRDSFIHNNSFSAAAALMRAHAASLGRESFTDEDLEYVLAMERKRMSRA